MHMLSLLLLFVSQPAHADYHWTIRCEYFFAQVPMSTVEFSVEPDGRFSPAARITMQGRTHLESFTQEENGPGERVHGWLSKENQNALELMIYEDGKSKVVNHDVPIGKEMWGSCAFPSLQPE
jgi:hypothetical protein